MATCLFTGETLTDSTHIEHTIPRALGGRIQSQVVSCDDFNNRTSSADALLVEAYAPLLSYLSPMVASAQKLGSREVMGHDGCPLYLDHELTLTMRQKILVTARDEDGKPKEFYARSQAEADALIAQLGIDKSRVVMEYVSADEGGRVTFAMPNSPTAELAALKSTLLTFDHLLADDPGHRFTRHPDLARVRKFVKDSFASEKISQPDYREHVLGLQYDDTAFIEQLRNDHLPSTGSSFEHVLIASGDTGRKSLNAIWYVAGVDPFGFRLSAAWTGLDFTFLVASGILKGGETVSKWLDTSRRVAKRTRYYFGSILSSSPKARENRKVLSQRRLERLGQACVTASLQAEKSQDTYVADALTRSAKHLVTLDAAYQAPAEILVRRLANIFRAALGAASSDRVFDNIAANVRTSELIPDKVSTLMEAPDWTACLPLYRTALNELEAALGRPSHLMSFGLAE